MLWISHVTDWEKRVKDVSDGVICSAVLCSALVTHPQRKTSEQSRWEWQLLAATGELRICMRTSEQLGFGSPVQFSAAFGPDTYKDLCAASKGVIRSVRKSKATFPGSDPMKWYSVATCLILEKLKVYRTCKWSLNYSSSKISFTCSIQAWRALSTESFALRSKSFPHVENYTLQKFLFFLAQGELEEMVPFLPLTPNIFSSGKQHWKCSWDNGCARMKEH